MRRRAPEWLLIAWFAYIAALCFFFPGRPYLGYKPFYVLTLVGLLIVILAQAERNSGRPIFNQLRDWTPLAFTLVAFRELDCLRQRATRWNGSIRGFNRTNGC